MSNCPSRKQDNHPIDALMAADMNALSFTERNRAIEELHGVDEIIVENPTYVAAALEALEMELNKIDDKPAYYQAFRMDPVYISNPKFRLMFLRADLFDPAKAAVRLVQFLELKLCLFGPEALARPLRLSDLDEDAMEMFRSGVFQILPERSQSGKLVVTACPNCHKYAPKSFDPFENAMKILFYMLTCHAENDEETQKRGYIYIVFFPGSSMTVRLLEIHQRMGNMGDMLPLRGTGAHLCARVNYFRTTKYLVMKSFTKFTRVRLRFHDGDVSECQCSLRTFGIPVHHLPLGGGAGLRNANHLKWISKQKLRDRILARTNQFNLVDVPANHDVLLGRGRNFQDHYGNIQMRDLVTAYIDVYEKGSATERENIRWKVMADILQNMQGRFLIRNKDGWFEDVPPEEVFEKIGRSFRTMLSTVRKLQTPTKCIETVDGKRARILVEANASDLCSGCS